jgi:Adenylate and Guanylate cyclase catalytic domain/zinc-ribbon domain
LPVVPHRVRPTLDGVQICPNCGEENPPRFQLCGICGTALVVELPAQERRKTVTIFFSDLKGSTNLGEALDSESLREVMTRYFDEMRAILEHHGGRVEKYIGDAIMAVFGLRDDHLLDSPRPLLHAGPASRPDRSGKHAMLKAGRLLVDRGTPCPTCHP